MDRHERRSEYRAALRRDAFACTCPWGARHGRSRGPCKHVLAAAIIHAGTLQAASPRLVAAHGGPDSDFIPRPDGQPQGVPPGGFAARRPSSPTRATFRPRTPLPWPNPQETAGSHGHLAREADLHRLDRAKDRGLWPGRVRNRRKFRRNRNREPYRPRSRMSCKYGEIRGPSLPAWHAGGRRFEPG